MGDFSADTCWLGVIPAGHEAVELPCVVAAGSHFSPWTDSPAPSPPFCHPCHYCVGGGSGVVVVPPVHLPSALECLIASFHSSFREKYMYICNSLMNSVVSVLVVVLERVT